MHGFRCWAGLYGWVEGWHLRWSFYFGFIDGVENGASKFAVGAGAIGMSERVSSLHLRYPGDTTPDR